MNTPKHSVDELKKEWVISSIDGTSASINGYKGTEHSITLPSQAGTRQITQIGERAFRPESHKQFRAVYRELTSVVIPEPINYIGHMAFANCKNLKEVVLPKTLNHIMYSAFENCCSLKRIEIPASLYSLDSDVFRNCRNLTECIFHSHDTKINGSAFFGCESLKQVKVREPDDTLADHLIQTGMYRPYHYSFCGCTSLESAKFAPDNKVISEGIFYGCTSLKDIVLPESTEYICSNAFRECESITHFSIPRAVKVICNWAFLKMINLELVDVFSPDVDIDPSAFKGCQKVTFRSYKGSTTEQFCKENGFPFVPFC